MSGLWKLYWLVVVATLGVYTAMLVWSLPVLTTAAAGLLPFDVRPAGYTPDQGRDFLSALFADGPKARDFYVSVQHRLDLVFPALVGISLAVPLIHLSRGWPWILRWLLAMMPWLGAGFDYAENAMVGGMLRALPMLPSDKIVTAASQMTVMKSGLITASSLVLLALLALAAVKKFREERGENEIHSGN